MAPEDNDCKIQDMRKLHREISQIVAQRLALTTLAVTVFAAGIAWIVPKDVSQIVNNVGGFRYIVSALIILTLFTLFVVIHFLSSMLRIMSTYLKAKKWSVWESDWKKYRDKHPRYLGYTKPQALIFIIFGTLAAWFPILLAFTFKVKVGPIYGLTLVSVLWIAYFIFVYGMGVQKWFIDEEKIEKNWEEVLDLTEKK